MKFYPFNYCPLRFAHLAGGYGLNNPCPDCGYGEIIAVAPDDVNYNVPSYGSLPSDLEDISFDALMHDKPMFFKSEHPSARKFNVEEWLNGDTL